MLSLMIEVLIHHPTESHTKVVASNLGFLEPPSVLSSGSLVFSHSVNRRDQCFWCFWSGWMLIASFIGRIYAPGGFVFFPSFCFPIWNYWDDRDRTSSKSAVQGARGPNTNGAILRCACHPARSLPNLVGNMNLITYTI
jgi:hypothetical protein